MADLKYNPPILKFYECQKFKNISCEMAINEIVPDDVKVIFAVI
jgi:hypothetical protein